MLFLVTMCGVLARPAAAELRYSTFSEPLDALTLLMAPPSEDAPTSTSAEVAPASQIPWVARQAGAQVVECDPVEARHQGVMLALLARRIEEAMDGILQHV